MQGLGEAQLGKAAEDSRPNAAEKVTSGWTKQVGLPKTGSLIRNFLAEDHIESCFLSQLQTLLAEPDRTSSCLHLHNPQDHELVCRLPSQWRWGPCTRSVDMKGGNIPYMLRDELIRHILDCQQAQASETCSREGVSSQKVSHQQADSRCAHLQAEAADHELDQGCALQLLEDCS